MSPLKEINDEAWRAFLGRAFQSQGLMMEKTISGVPNNLS